VSYSPFSAYPFVMLPINDPLVTYIAARHIDATTNTPATPAQILLKWAMQKVFLLSSGSSSSGGSSGSSRSGGSNGTSSSGSSSGGGGGRSGSSSSCGSGGGGRSGSSSSCGSSGGSGGSSSGGSGDSSSGRCCCGSYSCSSSGINCGSSSADVLRRLRNQLERERCENPKYLLPQILPTNSNLKVCMYVVFMYGFYFLLLLLTVCIYTTGQRQFLLGQADIFRCGVFSHLTIPASPYLYLPIF
jgi:hypothetical protein